MLLIARPISRELMDTLRYILYSCNWPPMHVHESEYRLDLAGSPPDFMDNVNFIDFHNFYSFVCKMNSLVLSIIFFLSQYTCC